MLRIVLVMVGWFICSNLYSQNLEKHHWSNRILIIKTKEEHSKKYQHQIDQFSNSIAELRDRKIVIYRIIGSKYSRRDYKNTDVKQENHEEVSLNVAKEILKEQNDFEIILIGLDGGIKLRKTDLVKKEELFNKIDSMPMRKAELRNSGY